MRDTVRYALPFGPLGEIARRLFVARDLEAIFDFRDRQRGGARSLDRERALHALRGVWLPTGQKNSYSPGSRSAVTDVLRARDGVGLLLDAVALDLDGVRRASTGCRSRS